MERLYDKLWDFVREVPFCMKDHSSDPPDDNLVMPGIVGAAENAVVEWLTDAKSMAEIGAVGLDPADVSTIDKLLEKLS